ncbi:MAG: hypothetical protein I4O49_17015 [Janthinobacterium lividum]|nr:hypothetical protein [Janthinobacterium lividum]
MRKTMTIAAGVAALGAVATLAAPTASALSGVPDLKVSITRISCDIDVTNVGGATATGVSLYSVSSGRLNTFPSTLTSGQTARYHVLDCPPGSPYPDAFAVTTANGDSNPFNNFGVLI